MNTNIKIIRDLPPSTMHSKKRRCVFAEVAVQDKLGFFHPIDELQKTLIHLNKQRERIFRHPDSKMKHTVLRELDSEIKIREERLRYLLNS